MLAVKGNLEFWGFLVAGQGNPVEEMDDEQWQSSSSRSHGCGVPQIQHAQSTLNGVGCSKGHAKPSVFVFGVPGLLRVVDMQTPGSLVVVGRSVNF